MSKTNTPEKTHEITMNKIIISLALGKIFNGELKFNDWESYDKENDKYGKELSEATKGLAWNWKSAFSVTFDFSETHRAEYLASAVIHHHGTLPQISIDFNTKKISVSSRGYSC